MAALAALGLAEAVRAAGHLAPHAGFQDPAGRWLLRIPGNGAGPGGVTTVCGIHRRRLHDVLRQAAGSAGAELVTGAEVTAIRPGTAGGEPAAVTWRAAAGEHARECDLVVAADGVHSTVRGQLFPAARPRYSGSTSWRAVIPDTSLDGRLTEVWGPGAEFGTLRVSDGEVYWYGEFTGPEGKQFPDELAAARARFAGWSPWIRDIIAATAPDQLMRHDVYHLPGGCPRCSARSGEPLRCSRVVTLATEIFHGCRCCGSERGLAGCLPSALVVPAVSPAPARPAAALHSATSMWQPRGCKDAPENNLEVSVAAALTTRHCFNDPGYRGPLPTRYRR